MASPAKVIPIVKTQHRSTRAFLSPAELLAVLKVAKARSTRDWAMVLMCYRHGMRASEVCGLKLSDVNVKEQWVRIERLKGSLTTVQPLAGHKGMPILDELAALKAYLRVRRADGSDFVFVSAKGGRLCRSGFYRLYSGLAVAAGLPPGKCGPHTLKHSIVSHLIAANTNIAIVKAAVGHKSLSSTMEYIHTSDAQVAEAVAIAMMKTF